MVYRQYDKGAGFIWILGTAIPIIIITGTMKSSNSKTQNSNTKSLESSSFKQVIRGVQSLIEDDDDLEVSNFDSYPSKSTHKPKSMMTNGEKLQSLMKNPEVRQKLNACLRNEGYMDIFPILKVDIKSASGGETEFPVYEEDLFEVFKRFENLERVMIRGNNTYVFYNDHISSYFAEKTLNGLVLRSVDVKLVVKWCQPHEYYDISGFLNFQRNCPLPELSRTNSGPTPKFTCRFRIQIENQKQFQVARKIIGSKGTNMKKIIDTCLFQIGADPNAESDIIKLRLRGKGSGYKQGPSKVESQDPLHLCISCRQEKAYAKACELVQNLLNRIYEQYKGFCIRTGRKIEELKCLRMDTNITSISKQSFYNFEQYNSQCLDLSENEIRMYIQARNKARRELNFIQADRIRSFLKSKGITLIDEKGGRGRGVEVTTWKVTRT